MKIWQAITYQSGFRIGQRGSQFFVLNPETNEAVSEGFQELFIGRSGCFIGSNGSAVTHGEVSIEYSLPESFISKFQALVPPLTLTLQAVSKGLGDAMHAVHQAFYAAYLQNGAAHGKTQEGFIRWLDELSQAVAQLQQ